MIDLDPRPSGASVPRHPGGTKARIDLYLGPDDIPGGEPVQPALALQFLAHASGGFIDQPPLHVAEHPRGPGAAGIRPVTERAESFLPDVLGHAVAPVEALRLEDEDWAWAPRAALDVDVDARPGHPFE